MSECGGEEATAARKEMKRDRRGRQTPSVHEEAESHRLVWREQVWMEGGRGFEGGPEMGVGG